MARQINVFVLVMLAVIVVRIATDGLSSELFDGSVLTQAAFLGIIAASFFSNKSCGSRSRSTRPTPKPAS